MGFIILKPNIAYMMDRRYIVTFLIMIASCNIYMLLIFQNIMEKRFIYLKPIINILDDIIFT